MAASFRRPWALAGAMLVLGFGANAARADFIVQVTSLLVTPPGAVTVSSGPGGSSTVTVGQYLDTPSDLTSSGSPADATSQSFGTTSVTTTRTTSGTKDQFNIPVEFTLTLSGTGGPGSPAQTATITLDGMLTGKVGYAFDGLSFHPTGGLAAPTTSPATSTYTPVVVDGATVYVALTAYTPPGTPPAVGVRDFAVYLYAAVPEPSTIALLGVGGVFLVAPRLRRLARRNTIS